MSPLTIHLRKVRGVPVFDLSGRLHIGPDLTVLDERVSSVMNESKPARLILNLSGLTSIDTAGIGQIMALFSRAVKNNCELVIAGATGRVIQSLRITRLDGVLKMADDVEAATDAG